jgi:hypothetical protein
MDGSWGCVGTWKLGTGDRSGDWLIDLINRQKLLHGKLILQTVIQSKVRTIIQHEIEHLNNQPNKKQ